MKKSIYFILILCFSLCLFGCEASINYSEEYDPYKEIEIKETIDATEIERLTEKTYNKWLDSDFEISETYDYKDAEGVLERQIIKKGNTLDDLQLICHTTNKKDEKLLGEMHIYVKEKMIYIDLKSSGIESKVKCSFDDLDIETVEDVIEELKMFGVNIKYYIKEIKDFDSIFGGTKSMGKDEHDNIVLSFMDENNEYAARVVFEDELVVYMKAESNTEEFREITFSYKKINIDFSNLVETEYVQE